MFKSLLLAALALPVVLAPAAAATTVATESTSVAAAAPSCTVSWQSASWGRAKLCGTFSGSNLVRIYGKIEDTKTDGYCASLGFGATKGQSQIYAADSCTTNVAVSFDFKLTGGAHFTSVQLRQFNYPSATQGNYMTLWNPGAGCVAPAEGVEAIPC